jgi:LacI family transcriptional regulator
MKFSQGCNLNIVLNKVARHATIRQMLFILRQGTDVFLANTISLNYWETAIMKKVAVLIDTSLSLGRDLLRGIVQYANTQGPWLFYHEHQVYKTRKEQHELITKLKQWEPDGIIIREKKIHEEIINMDIPLIISSHMQHPIKNMANLVADDFGIGQIGGEYLLKRGFRNFAFCGYKNLLWSKVRYRGFLNKLQKVSLEADLYEFPISKMEKNLNQEISKIGNWLQSLPKPLAVMTCSDQVSQHITEACKLFEIPIFKDLPLARSLHSLENAERS